MTAMRVACLLSAVVCTAAHAHHAPSCSGGAGGGVDATGNQCNAAGHDVETPSQSDVITRQAAAIAAPLRSSATVPGSREVGVTPGPQIATIRRPTGRMAHEVNQAPAEPLVRAAKMGNAEEAICSGGSDGGTDATGNQCNPVNPTTSVLPVQASGR
jgi:hypothetical protein